MVSLVYDDWWAAVLYWGTYSVFVLLDARLVLRAAGAGAGSDAARGLVHRPVGLGVILGAEAVGLVVAAIGVAVLPGRWVWLTVGLALAWAGIALRWSAKRALGRFFVGAIVIQPDHQLVTDGPYARIRHPGYAGGGLALAGLGIATADALAMLLFVVVPAVVFVRTIGREDAVLAAHLGPAHADYLRRTSRLVPGIW